MFGGITSFGKVTLDVSAGYAPAVACLKFNQYYHRDRIK